jgi:hypothetical protein
MCMSVYRILVGVVAFLPAVALAQSPRRVDDEAATWIAYTGVHPLSPNWRLHLETQLRQTEGTRQPQQRLFRTALLRVLNPAVRVGGGYGFTRAYPPEEFVTNPQPVNEHRTYLQVDLNQPAGPLHVDHRYRLEQRWIQRLQTSTTDAGWTYTNRARYFLRGYLAPGGGTPSDGEAYVVAYDEVFVNFGKNVRNNVFDQNRLFAGVGYRWSRALSTEVGYMNQLAVRSSGTDVERNHTIVIAFSSSAPLRRF